MRNCSPNRGGQQKWTRNNEGFRIRSPRSKDEDLALFHDMRTRENTNFLHPSTDDFEASLPTKLGGLTGFRVTASPTPSWKGTDLLATADSDKTDYDWLLTPPGTPLFPSLDKDSLQAYMDHSIVPQSYSASKGTRFPGSNTPELHRMSRRSPGPRTPPSTASSTSSSHSFSKGRAPSPSRAGSSPTLRPSTPVKTLARSTTIMNRTSTRSSPPVLRRTNTSPNIRSSSTERNAPPLKARSVISPKMQAWQAPELGFSAEPPPNLRTSLSDRPVSSTRNGTARPRTGVSEARHHQEARHSYSDALESRQSHWRNSSSSASKFSSSTTSQDRWSSRGSVVSSSDDGMDVIEPTFLDYGATSPSSTSGTSKTVSGRFDNEVSSRHSPVLSRQKKLSTSTAETAVFSSASARKSLEPSMQRVDHRRVSQNMFRPLMSSAPSTSYCNVGPTAGRHRPANPFVEPSITPSSNASSERGVRIFPGNESSDEEVESEWDKGLPTGSVMSKFVLDENDAIDEVYNRVHDHVDQYERESVADNASSIMDGCEADRALYVNTLEWGRIQTSGEADSQEEDQKSRMSKPSFKGIVHNSSNDSIDQDGLCCNTQQASANQLCTNSIEDIQKNSAWLYPDSITPHMSHHVQNETEVCDERFNYNKPYKANDEDCLSASKKSSIEQAVCSPERHRNAQDCYDAEQNQQIRMNPPVIESITNGCMDESISCHENHIASLHCHVVELPLSVQVTPLKKSADCAGSVHGKIDVLQNDSLQEMKTMSVLLSEEAYAMGNTPASFDSGVAGMPLSGHVEREDFDPKSPIAVGQQSPHHQEPRVEISSFLSTPSSEMQRSLVWQPELALQASCQEYYIDTLETEEGVETKGPNCYSVMTPENQLLTENETTFDSDKFSGIHRTEETFSGVDQIEDCQFGSVCHVINLDSEDIEQLSNALSQNEFVQASLRDEEKNPNCHVHADGLLSSLQVSDTRLQDNEHCPFDADPSMVPGGENSFEDCLATEVSKDGELPNSSDDAASAVLLNIPQPPDELQPESSFEQFLMQTGGAVGLEAKGVEDMATHVNSPNMTQRQQQPQRGSPLKTYASPGLRAATPSFSLEEATNTILFCSSIVHDMIYKAASIATEKETEAMKAAPLVSQSRGQNASAAFISSLRVKVSKSATWKVRHKEAKAFNTKPQREEVSELPPTITKHPTPIIGMDREPARVEADKALPDNTKEKSFMGMSVNSNCQCTIM